MYGKTLYGCLERICSVPKWRRTASENYAVHGERQGRTDPEFDHGVGYGLVEFLSSERVIEFWASTFITSLGSRIQKEGERELYRNDRPATGSQGVHGECSHFLSPDRQTAAERRYSEPGGEDRAAAEIRLGSVYQDVRRFDREPGWSPTATVIGMSFFHCRSNSKQAERRVLGWWCAVDFTQGNEDRSGLRLRRPPFKLRIGGNEPRRSTIEHSNHRSAGHGPCAYGTDSAYRATNGD